MKELRIQYNSPVVLTFFLLSLGALALGEFTGERTTWLLFTVYRSPLTDPLTSDIIYFFASFIKIVID